MDVDIYVLAKNRSAETARDFLERYLPERNYNDGKYEFYSYEGNEEVEFKFDSENEMLELIEKKETLTLNCPFYPINQNELLRMIQLYYLSDGGMICCININQNDEKENELLNELKLFLGSKYGMISYHIPPPNTKTEFINTVNQITKND